MNQRSEILILNEYLGLIADLNKSNKFKDEMTQIYFEIVTETSGQQVLYAQLSKDQKIRICEKNTNFGWVGVCSYPRLSNFTNRLLEIYDLNKHTLKILFNEFFYIEFNKLLSFK